MGFDGYAVGGVSVGEPEELILQGHGPDACRTCRRSGPRYVMGVGMFTQMVEAVARGRGHVRLRDADPVRRATARRSRGGAATRSRPGGASRTTGPIEEGCGCYACRHFSRAYVRHLLNVDEILGVRLVTMHNLYRYAEFMREMREAIAGGPVRGLSRGLPRERTGASRGKATETRTRPRRMAGRRKSGI